VGGARKSDDKGVMRSVSVKVADQRGLDLRSSSEQMQAILAAFRVCHLPFVDSDFLPNTT
jgi:hypothetical protein